MTVPLRYLLLFGIAVSGLAALAFRGGRGCHSDKMLDQALDETFPASDPTSSQDFAIPANRM